MIYFYIPLRSANIVGSVETKEATWRIMSTLNKVGLLVVPVDASDKEYQCWYGCLRRIIEFSPKVSVIFHQPRLTFLLD